VTIGSTYRADMWAALEDDPTLSAAALARRIYGSFATAWHVRRDFAVLAAAGGVRSAHSGAVARGVRPASDRKSNRGARASPLKA
jgi:hypothetical protein